MAAIACSFSVGLRVARILAAARALTPIARIVAAMSSPLNSSIGFFSATLISATFQSRCLPNTSSAGPRACPTGAKWRQFVRTNLELHHLGWVPLPKHERPAQGAGRLVEIQAGRTAPGPICERSVRQRVRTKLELDDLGRRSLAGFTMEWWPVAVRRPQTAALPAAIRIINAAIDPLGEEAQRIGHPHVDPLAIDERHQGLVGVAGRQRHVVAKAERVLLVDPGVVAGFSAAAFCDIAELRAWERRQRPAFRTHLAFSGLRAVEWAFALAAVEGAEVTARQRHIGDAVAVDIITAGAEARERRLVDFRQLGLRIEPQHIARLAEHSAPDGAVRRVHADAVEAGIEPLILGGIDGLVGLHVFVGLAVAVGVDDDRRPALGLGLIAGLFPDPAVQPAHDALLRPALADPNGVISILRQYDVVSVVAGSDQLGGVGLRVIHREMSGGFLDREGLGGWVIRSGLTECRVLGFADLRGEPDLRLLVHDQAVDAGLAIPDRLFAPIGRRRHGVVLG